MCTIFWFVVFDAGVSSQCYDVRNDTICYFQPTNGKEMSWDDADKFCRDNNATLPVILHSDHQRTIEEYLSPFNKTNTVVFTAGRKSSSNNSQWRWVNGKQLRSRRTYTKLLFSMFKRHFLYRLCSIGF